MNKVYIRIRWLIGQSVSPSDDSKLNKNSISIIVIHVLCKWPPQNKQKDLAFFPNLTYWGRTKPNLEATPLTEGKSKLAQFNFWFRGRSRRRREVREIDDQIIRPWNWVKFRLWVPIFVDELFWDFAITALCYLLDRLWLQLFPHFQCHRKSSAWPPMNLSIFQMAFS